MNNAPLTNIENKNSHTKVKLLSLAGTLAGIFLVASPAMAENVIAWNGADPDDSNWTSGLNWGAFNGNTNPPANDGTVDVWVSWFGNARLSPVVDVPYLVNTVFLPNGVPSPVTLSGSTLTVDFDTPGSTGSTGAIQIQGNGTLVFQNAVNLSAASNPLVGNNGSLMQFDGALTATASGSITTMTSSQTGFAFNGFQIGSTGSFTGSELDIVSTANGVGFPAGGVTLRLDHSQALVDSLTLKLVEASSTLNDAAKLNLSFIGSETIGSLFINGVAQPFGTYGATGSGATIIDDIHFLGTGTLTVVPEPATSGLLITGMLVLLGSRGSRSIKLGRITADRGKAA
jgi:hypothetical protein